MDTTARIAVVFLTLAYLAGAAAQAEDEFVLSIEGGGDALLGEAVPLRIRLAKKRGKPATVNTLRIARSSISLRVMNGGRSFLVTRIYGREVILPDGTVRMTASTPPRSELRRGKPLWLETSVLALLPGPTTVQAVYSGLPEGSPELRSDVVGFEVRREGDRDRIGAVIETSEGALFLELWPERAFMTVHHFLSLARSGRYQGTTFHRVIRGHLIQGGDPKGDGTGRPDFTIPGEFDPEIRHEKGVISMARAAPLPDSAGMQFFIMDGSDERLDGKYAAFGRVVDGLDVLDRLASVPVRRNPKSGELSLPEEPPIIRSIRVLAK